MAPSAKDAKCSNEFPFMRLEMEAQKAPATNPLIIMWRQLNPLTALETRSPSLRAAMKTRGRATRESRGLCAEIDPKPIESLSQDCIHIAGSSRRGIDFKP